MLDELIVGVAHQFSNRIAALTGVSDLLALSPAIPPSLRTPLRALTDELPKLDEALRLLRLLSLPDEPEEAVEPLGVVQDAIALAVCHPRLKGVTYTVNAQGAVPVLAHPVALMHRIVLALAKAAERRMDEGTDEAVRVELRVEGGELVIAVGERTVRVPTLVASRAAPDRV